MITTKNHVWLIGTAVVLGSLLYFYFDPSLNHFFPPCPFYSVTGYYCPGCGSQRAFHDLLHGDIWHAAGHNILFVLFLPLILFAAIAGINNIFRKKKIAQYIFNSTSFALVTLVTVLLFWGLRNLPYAPFCALAP